MLKRNIIANFLGQGWTALMGVAFIPLYIGYLGVEAYGLIGFYALMQVFLSLLDMGIAPTINREMARFTGGARSAESAGGLLRSLEGIGVALAASLVVTVGFVSPWLASEWIQSAELPSATVSDAIVIMGLVLGARILEGLYRGVLLGIQRQVMFNALNSAIATFRWGGAVGVLAWWSPSIEAYFLWQAVVSVCAVAVLSIAAYRSLPFGFWSPRPSFEAIKGVWAFSAGVAGIMFFNLILTQFDKVLLVRLVSLKEFGYYSLAATVAAVGHMVAGPVVQAVYPRFVECADSESCVVPLYHKSSQMITVLVAPLMLLFCLYSEPVLYVWSGDAELARNTSPILSVLAIGVLFNALLYAPYYYQLSIGWTSLPLVGTIIASLIFVPALLLVIPQYGVIGAAWLTVLLYSSYFLLSVQYMHGRVLVKERFDWYVSDVFFPVAGACVVLLVGRMFQPDMTADRVVGFLFLIMLGLLAVIAAVLSASRLRGAAAVVVSSVLRRNSGIANWR